MNNYSVSQPVTTRQQLSRLQLQAAAELELRRRSGAIAPLWQPNPDNGNIPNPQRLAAESEADILGFGGGGGGGKALSLDTLLPTANGWVSMGNVKVGDHLFDDYGLPCQVIAVSPIMYNHICYNLIFSDGSTIVADAEHKWLTITAKERISNTRRTEEFRKKRRETRPTRGTGKRPDLVQTNKEKQHFYLHPSNGAIHTTQQIKDTMNYRSGTNHSIKVCAPLQLPDIHLPIDPYVLGCWLGDGSSYKAEITTADPEILNEIQPYYATKHRVDYTHGIYGLVTELKRQSLIGNKHIPALYLRASVSQRIALLQGLMDTDGYCDMRGQCEFTTIKEGLANQFLELLGTLGIKAAIQQGEAKLNGRNCGLKYRIKFITDIPAFRLPRKLNRQKRSDFRGTHNYRYIVDVELVDSVPVRCIAVNSPSRLYLAGKSFIPTHNTDLLLGLASTQHYRSVIFRRVFPSLRGIIDRSRELFNPGNYAHSKGSFNESLHRWSLGDGRQIELEACQLERDKEKQRGRPRDFYGFDEVTEFSRSQVEFIIGWLRSTRAGQRCRVVMTFNPPSDDAGGWVVDYFLPWIAYLFPADYTHPNPAAPGELRWYATLDGVETEYKDGEPFEHNGELIKPLCRTFIPAKLADNPHLANTNYAAVLQSLPEPLRSQVLYGDFAAAKEANPWQVIPTAWVRLAQQRWLERERPISPLSSAGVDVARGGRDKLVISKRYDNWFDELIAHPGVNVEDGPAAAELVRQSLGEQQPTYINIDVIGVGTSAYDSLKTMYAQTVPVNVGEGSNYRDRSGKLKMRNKRSEYYWRLREALDPEHGDDIALPPGNELLADLCSANYKVTAAGIQIEDKDEIKKRIGRSPDLGEAVILALGGEYHAPGVLRVKETKDEAPRWNRSKVVSGGRWR